MLGWVKGSVLRPILAVLEPHESEAFQSQLADRYRARYPPGADGTTIFAFSRLFVVAKRR